ncbi:MAG: hypothetical protein AAFW97_14610 [Pseudomonadota bacterium]
MTLRKALGWAILLSPLVAGVCLLAMLAVRTGHLLPTLAMVALSVAAWKVLCWAADVAWD